MRVGVEEFLYYLMQNLQTLWPEDILVNGIRSLGPSLRSSRIRELSRLKNHNG